MYRRALWTPSLALRSSASTSRHTLSYRPIHNVHPRPRYFSTPLPPPDNKLVPQPPLKPSPQVPPENTQPGDTHAQEKSETPQSHSPSSTSFPESRSSSSSSSAASEAQLDDIRARVKEWSTETLKGMRQRGDEWTVQVARTFAQLGKELNRATGYEEIDVLKRKVGEQEARIYNAREAARQAKEAYDSAVLQRAKSQREVNDLLQRKSHWTDEDVSRFTTLVREDHAREQDESRAKAAATAAEDAVEREFSELMRVILNRYHEEQVWSDKIRSASTYGQLAVLALNLAVFVLAIVLVEPWKRRRLAQTFERKVEEMSARTEATFTEKNEKLRERLDEQAQMLSTFLEQVHLSTQVSASELAGSAAGEETTSAHQGESGRIPAIPRGDQAMLLAMTASAAAAGLIGWIARSWYG
ncbi:Mdm33 family-domain-containing protein [Cerioporus squamosus]|nr:Mdm33 family-domain-containing protein [Cerioporus squamosus]